jgi:hypothetical protein
MAENETNEAQETKETGGSGARTAVKAAAAAAVTGAAAMAARKALSSNGKSSNGVSSAAKDAATKARGSSTLLTSIASGGWDAARDTLLPLAEDAAGAAGTYLAKNGPEIVRDKIVPRFISSFNEAKGD